MDSDTRVALIVMYIILGLIGLVFAILGTVAWWAGTILAVWVFWILDRGWKDD